MRRSNLVLLGLLGLVVAMFPTPAGAATDTSEWTAIRYLNKARVDLGLSKLTNNQCLDRAAEAAAPAITYLSLAELAKIRERCGLTKVQQFGCGCPNPWAATATTAWIHDGNTRMKWAFPSHSVIGVARIAAKRENYETHWFVFVGTPAAS